ncbi:MAG TPA: cupin domain-containing protein [Trueperaceae bacterium]|nr:cupin domain-containing protein [Trueperaceae bacterium]
MVTKNREDGYRPLAGGITMQNLVHGDETSMARFRLARGSRLPLHSHPHEQTGIMLSGSVRFTIDGEEFPVGPGDSWCIPGDVEHAVDVLEDSVIVEVFSPVREEYLD